MPNSTFAHAQTVKEEYSEFEQKELIPGIEGSVTAQARASNGAGRRATATGRPEASTVAR